VCRYSTRTGAGASATAKVNKQNAAFNQRLRILVSHAAAAMFVIVNAILHQRRAKLAISNQYALLVRTLDFLFHLPNLGSQTFNAPPHPTAHDLYTPF
jgi:hypothetical protein